MGKKMYYSEEEAAELLGISTQELADHVGKGKLRVFQDGPKKMFRVDEVDQLAGVSEEHLALEGVGSTSGLADLMTGSQDSADVISLGEAEAAEPAPKEDTVITAEGISIFDDEDLEIEAADPMAKTQIAPGIEDQISLEGVGSGSGLLDLTRESDDTSLGAEVLDHIDIEGAAPAVAPPLPASSSVATIPAEPVAAAAPPVYIEAADSLAGLFGGMIVGCAVVAVLLSAAAFGGASIPVPTFLATLKAQMPIVVGAGFVVILVGGVVGWLMGKSAAARQVT